MNCRYISKAQLPCNDAARARGDVDSWAVYDVEKGYFVSESYSSERDAIEEAIEANVALSEHGLEYGQWIDDPRYAANLKDDKPKVVAHADTLRLTWIASHLKEYRPGLSTASVKIVDDNGAMLSTTVHLPADLVQAAMNENKDLDVLRHVVDTLIVRYTTEINS